MLPTCGSTATATAGAVGAGPGSDGNTVTVTGMNSAWNSASLIIGEAASTTTNLLLADGGALHVTRDGILMRGFGFPD